jgi:hypothetical protein
MLKAALALVVTALVVCVAAFGWLKLAPRHVPSGQPPLRTIESASLPAFRNAFNANEGEVRILAMLSPT